MKKINLVFMLIFVSVTGKGQYIIAGQHDSTDYYYEFNPSQSLYLGTNIINEINLIYDLDVNQDGTNDFEFNNYHSSRSLGLQKETFAIKSLNNNQICYGSMDSCDNLHGPISLGQDQMTYYFNDNDTINGNFNWVNSSAYLFYGCWISGQNNCNGYPSQASQYIGFRFIINSNIEYGWIKIDYYTPSIVSYAFKKPILSSANMTILGNPSSQGNYTIHLPDDISSSNDILLSVYDDKGSVVLNDDYADHRNETEIYLAGKSNGIYLIRLSDGKKSYTGKIVKR